MFKSLVIFLAMLATLKIGYQEYLHRSTTNDLIIAAYRDRALATCRNDPKSRQLGLGLASWTKPTSISLSIGKPSLDVRLWQVDHDLWEMRYRTPFLLITPGGKGPSAFCEFDLVRGSANIQRL